MGIMAKSRIVAPWSLASLAFAAIAMGFRANEPSMAPTPDVPLAGAAAVAQPGVLQRRSEISVPPADFDVDRRAQAAGSSALFGANDGTELRRARPSRGEPGLQVSNSSAPAARTRVTPGVLPPRSQPGFSAARSSEADASEAPHPAP
jgi:hypothetical protein